LLISAGLRGQLKSPPNIGQASVAADGRATQNYVQQGERFPAHAYPRTTVTRTCAYNRNVQQPSTKKIITSRSEKKNGLTHNQIFALVRHALDPDDGPFFLQQWTQSSWSLENFQRQCHTL